MSVWLDDQPKSKASGLKTDWPNPSTKDKRFGAKLKGLGMRCLSKAALSGNRLFSWDDKTKAF